MIKHIKNSLPHSLKQRVKQLTERISIFAAGVFSSSGFLASLHYTFFSRQFYREHKAVLQGRLAYQRSLQQPGASSPLLRRNIHRLEKGLIMQPRRPTFAEDYITETVNAYLVANRQTAFCRQELQWAHDVLQRYFKEVKPTRVIEQALRQFSTVAALSAAGAEPYAQQTAPKTDISYDQLFTLFTRRRSVRWYLAQPVPETLIHQAITAASLAPSACNRQPYQFIVLNDALKAAAAAECAMGTTGFAQNIPCLLVVTGDLSAYPAERDRHVIYIDASLASMQLMLALETLGLSSCPINWPDIEQREQKLSAMLGLPYYQRVIMLLAVGYADPQGGIAYSQKKAANLLIRDEQNHVG